MTTRRLPLLWLLVTSLLLSGGCFGGSDTSDTATVDQPYIAKDQLRCLALAMYWEAKAEGDEGMLAVGQVVLNRAAHTLFPNTPCTVVQEGGETPPCQFSWWCDGKSDTPTEFKNWDQAQLLAQRLMLRRPQDKTRGALFFHSTRISNPWRKKRTKTATIGGHVFYAM